MQLTSFSELFLVVYINLGLEKKDFRALVFFFFLFPNQCQLFWHAFCVWYLVTDCFLAVFFISKWELRVCKQMRFHCAADVAFCVSWGKDIDRLATMLYNGILERAVPSL